MSSDTFYREHKTKKEKERDFGLDINLVELDVDIIQKRKVSYSVKFEIIYKKITININNDKYTVGRVIERLKLSKNKSIKINKVKIIKKIGNGIYEKENG
jgi:hypothetical protein